MKQYIVDAFTDKPFAGNPAAVCVIDEGLNEDEPTEEFMRLLAAENNLSETAFAVRADNGYRLRWFTPGAEVDLCGHATLATAFVILNHVHAKETVVQFHTRSGELTVTRHGNLYEMDFPVYEQREIPVTEEMAKAYGLRPQRAFLGTDLVAVFAEEGDVAKLVPNQNLLLKLPGRIQNATAPSLTCDFVSRSFAPKLNVPEDPVCGSAHCQIAPYWGKVLGKREVHAYQASKRGGHLYCKLRKDGRISISGQAVLVAVAEITATL